MLKSTRALARIRRDVRSLQSDGWQVHAMDGELYALRPSASKRLGLMSLSLTQYSAGDLNPAGVDQDELTLIVKLDGSGAW